MTLLRVILRLRNITSFEWGVRRILRPTVRPTPERVQKRALLFSLDARRRLLSGDQFGHVRFRG
jgi:hypothetical protein